MGENKGNNQQPPAPAKKNPAPQNNPQGKVAPIKAEGCVAEGCKIKPSRAGFCEEHYIWFKEGLVTKDGRRPVDFDKKFFNFQQRRAKSA